MDDFINRGKIRNKVSNKIPIHNNEISKMIRIIIGIIFFIIYSSAFADQAFKCSVKGTTSDSVWPPKFSEQIIVAIIESSQPAIEIEGPAITELLISSKNQTTDHNIEDLSNQKNWFLKASGKTVEGYDYIHTVKISKNPANIEVLRKHKSSLIRYEGKCKKVNLMFSTNP
jgi:hypothetical protein